MINARITWETGKMGAQTGYILGKSKGYEAKTQVFAISYTHDRDLIRAGTPYTLAHRLPFRGIARHFPTLKAALEASGV